MQPAPYKGYVLSRFRDNIARGLARATTYAGEPITYTRDSVNTYTIQAIPGNALANSDGVDTTQITSTSRDFIFAAESIPFAPEAEDMIYWDDRKYLVSAGDFAEVFSYVGPGPSTIRVHTQEVTAHVA